MCSDTGGQHVHSTFCQFLSFLPGPERQGGTEHRCPGELNGGMLRKKGGREGVGKGGRKGEEGRKRKDQRKEGTEEGRKGQLEWKVDT